METERNQANKAFVEALVALAHVAEASLRLQSLSAAAQFDGALNQLAMVAEAFDGAMSFLRSAEKRARDLESLEGKE